MDINGGGPMEEMTLDILAGLLGEWHQIWESAERIQRTFPQDVVDRIMEKSTDPQAALLDQAGMLATMHPEVIAFFKAVLSDAEATVRQLADRQPVPRRRDDDEVLDSRELTKRVRQLETLMWGAGAVMREAQPSERRRPATSSGDVPHRSVG